MPRWQNKFLWVIVALGLSAILVLIYFPYKNFFECSEGIRCVQKQCTGGNRGCEYWMWLCENSDDPDANNTKYCPANIPVSRISTINLSLPMKVSTRCYERNQLACNLDIPISENVLGVLHTVEFCPYKLRKPGYSLTFSTSDNNVLSVWIMNYQISNIDKDDIFAITFDGETKYPCFQEGQRIISDLVNSVIDFDEYR